MARQRAPASMGRASTSTDRSSSVTTTSAPSSEDQALPPFFNTTFSTHRTSPLFVGKEGLTSTRLQHLARRLREVLVGDVVRGIQIGLEATDTPRGQVGVLRAVSIRWFRAGDVLGGDDRAQGLWIEIRHENAAYAALLLPGVGGARARRRGEMATPAWMMRPGQDALGQEVDESQFLHLPLLLLRMPQALKTVIIEWLSSNFDCRVSKLTLGTKTLVSVWESWIQTAGIPGRGADFVITLSFNAPLPDSTAEDPENDEQQSPDNPGADGDEEEPTEKRPPEPGLKTMEIIISPPDLRRFHRAGKQLDDADAPKIETGHWAKDPRERRRLAGPNIDDGWAWRAADDYDAPFTEALARYLDHHFALNLFHPGVRVVQISCSGFVLAQSRLKIVQLGEMTDELSYSAWAFVTQLGERVRGRDDGSWMG